MAGKNSKSASSRLQQMKSLTPYLESGHDLIPLAGRSKRPRDSNWTTRDYTSSTTVKVCVRERCNVGVRLRRNQLVIDVDPRNGGTAGFDKLCLDLGIDPDRFPRVITGSSGSHYYMRKPVDVSVLDTLETYAGVEFKSKGRQVVAAGSVHPDTGKRYRWHKDSPPLADAPAAPKRLLKAIKRPERPASASEGGEYTQEQIAKALAALDVLKFKQHDEWLKLMMACHHASNGDARDEFVEWSTGDPDYADDADLIGRRWDSLHAQRVDGVTARTLARILVDHGAADAIPANEIGDDFDEPADVPADDDSWLEAGLPPPPKLAKVDSETIDDAFALVNTGSKTQILYWGKSTFDPSIRVPEFWPEAEFHRALKNKFITVESKVERDGATKIESKRMPLSNWWLTRRDRYTYDGLIFDAEREPASEEDEINLWRGFGVQPDGSGSWKLMRRHIREIIAADDSASDDYIMRWLAWAVQHPTTQAEVALVLLSEGKGTGKGFLGRAMCRLFGGHALHIAKRNLLTGRFNAHFMQCAFLFADEALWPGHKDDEGALQTLVTEPLMTIEPKGLNAFSMPNALKVMLASNAKWVVPASGDERRYAVFEVSDAHKQDHRYFQKLAREIEHGGLAAMLHDLLAMDLNGWHPRVAVPHTAALAGQQWQSAPPEVKWLAGLLEEGTLPDHHARKPDRARGSDLYRHARIHEPGLRFWSDVQLAQFLNEWGVQRKESHGVWRVFPPLAEMRATFRERFPWAPTFSKARESWVADIHGEL